ncbi:MAG: tRNA epoxyqueuosine(34) reductase QueG [Betaproteobacteria bacterium]|nr:MAG: tRNA epoxyqueuosine(34) reductase QueG [Betaproteobacteria bacterium]
MPYTEPELKANIRRWGAELGFTAVHFAPTNLGHAEPELVAWLAAGFHGEMDYMARHGVLRARPTELVPGTRSIISVRLDYQPDAADAETVLADPERAYISRYALGRDYHKVIRHRLQKLADRISAEIGPFAYRAFTDSAPLLEVELAARAGSGWRGKHSLLLTRAGSWFFLGELLTDLALSPDLPEEPEHCGTCSACITVCPTAAIIAPYQVDARRCISYLTIEHAGVIPIALRPLMGNRIYGCDDCQLVCPWNRYATPSRETDFQPRHGLDHATLIDLFTWTEAEFEQRLAGSPIRRIGWGRWLRNIAVALGNGPRTEPTLAALHARRTHPDNLVREHVEWALAQHASPNDHA